VQHDDDLTAEGFWRRVAAKRAVAAALIDDKAYCVEAYIAAGFAVECALKAIIMRRNRWNAWPSARSAPGLHTHKLRDLFGEAGIDLATAPVALRAKLRQVLDWTRGHDYYAKRMPRAIAASMSAAVFDDEGVIEWLKTMGK